jgi:hypothetical protein
LETLTNQFHIEILNQKIILLSDSDTIKVGFLFIFVFIVNEESY